MNHHCKLHLKRREDPKNEKSLLYQNGNNENDGILDVCLCEPSIPRMRKKIICQTQYILLARIIPQAVSIRFAMGMIE
ncbi:uncharacterized protein LOC144647326 isoform X7 [Oculina patagonica]